MSGTVHHFISRHTDTSCLSPCFVMWTEGQKPVNTEGLLPFSTPDRAKKRGLENETRAVEVRVCRFPTEQKHVSAAHRNVFF